ncbi:RNA-binding protein [Candidatus Woesearchaeota archaeon CG_4_10_14_0_2_um_filter_57_5]|nr:MAG: RNA-binding protein [Candidatus Woesearchaeota archaeon CG_4_10_14_0_2_um_filter_57_5]
MEKVCVTTKVPITNIEGSVNFPCPQCNEEIVRSGKARAIAARYTCPKCGFTGPN